MKKPFLLVLSLFAATLVAHSVPGPKHLVAYWNMDSENVLGKLDPNAGSQAGTVSMSILDIDVGFFSEVESVAGTAENILPPAPSTNRAIGFYHGGSVYHAGSLIMEGFDFTGLSDVSISFAYFSENLFTWDSHLHVDYRINGGSWVDISEEETWAPNWQIANISFGDLLDGETDVDIRIRAVDWISAIGHLSVDNIQITAVPEPQTLALFASLLLVLGVVLSRRRGKIFTC